MRDTLVSDGEKTEPTTLQDSMVDAKGTSWQKIHNERVYVTLYRLAQVEIEIFANTDPAVHTHTEPPHKKREIIGRR